METFENRASDPHEPGSQVATLVPLPGSVLGAVTIVAAQGALAATATFVAMFANHDGGSTSSVGASARGDSPPRSCSRPSRSRPSPPRSVSPNGERGPDRLTFGVQAAVMCGYLLTFVFDPLRALVGIGVAVGVIALVLGRQADEVFAPVENT